MRCGNGVKHRLMKCDIVCSSLLPLYQNFLNQTNESKHQEGLSELKLDLLLSYLVSPHHEVREPHIIVESDLAGRDSGGGKHLQVRERRI